MNEIWKDVVGFEGLYEVSNLGRVRTNENTNWGHYKSGKVFNPGLTPQGYLMVYLWKDRLKISRTVHSMVLEAFNGPRPFGHVTRHKNGVRTQNNIDNLEWGTHQENQNDRKRHGTSNAGSRHGMSMLTELDVVRIRDMFRNGLSQTSIAKEFAITQSNVSYIVHRKTWNHV